MPLIKIPSYFHEIMNCFAFIVEQNKEFSRHSIMLNICFKTKSEFFNLHRISCLRLDWCIHHISILFTDFYWTIIRIFENTFSPHVKYSFTFAIPYKYCFILIESIVITCLHTNTVKTFRNKLYTFLLFD